MNYAITPKKSAIYAKDIIKTVSNSGVLQLELKEVSILKTKYPFKNAQYNRKFKMRKPAYSWKKL